MRHRWLQVVLLALIGGTAAQAQGIREVTYGANTVVPVHGQVRFTTLLVLPEGERILDYVCGDKEFWIVSGAENLAYVKPAKSGAQTDLHLVTESGHLYAFLLTEAAGEPDLTVYVRAPAAEVENVVAPPRFYAAGVVEALRAQVDDVRAELATTEAATATAINTGIAAFRTTYAGALRFPYRFKAHQPPFDVTAIFHDGQFTYIQAGASELPALYEVRDGAPNLVPFQVEGGVYIVPKVLAQGYLAIGRQRLSFEAR
jgi:type IV secretion system protein VirB9